MLLDFDLWPWQWQNVFHIAKKGYSTLGEFYPNIRLEPGLQRPLTRAFVLLRS